MKHPPQKLAIFSLGAGYTTRSKAFGLFVVLCLLSFFLSPTVVKAATVTETFAYQSDLPVGTVVSVSQENPDQLEKTNLNNQEYVAGVVTNSQDGAVNLGTSTNTLFIAISGDVQVYAPTAGGEIKSGDLLGPSQLNGVAQKLEANQGGQAIGVALADFANDSAEKQTVNGEELAVGLLPIRLLLSDVANPDQGQDSALEKIGLSIAGEPVSNLRMIIAGIMFITATAVSGFMLFASIKGSFDSVGRNPLASESIFASLAHVTLVASAIMIVGLVVAYLVVVL